MSSHRYVIADVFTDTPLEGNPLAVFTDAEAIPEAILQRLARELNLSETNVKVLQFRALNRAGRERGRTP